MIKGSWRDVVSKEERERTEIEEQEEGTLGVNMIKELQEYAKMLEEELIDEEDYQRMKEDLIGQFDVVDPLPQLDELARMLEEDLIFEEEYDKLKEMLLPHIVESMQGSMLEKLRILKKHLDDELITEYDYEMLKDEVLVLS